MPRPTRLHMALVVVGATFAIMLLAVLQVAQPILLGLRGLVTVMLLDLAVAVLYRHRGVGHDTRVGPALRLQKLCGRLSHNDAESLNSPATDFAQGVLSRRASRRTCPP